MSKKNSKSLRNLYMSMMTLVLSIAMLTAATWVLFTATKTVNHHVTAGNLKLEFHEVRLDAAEAEGVKKIRDLSVSSDPIFSTNATVVQPGYSESRFVRIENTGKVSFDFKLSIINARSANATPTAADLALLEQVKVEIKKVRITNGAWEVVDDTAAVANKTNPVSLSGTLPSLFNFLKGSADADLSADTIAYYCITVSFPHTTNGNNNDAMGGGIEFDINLCAVQDSNKTADDANLN